MKELQCTYRICRKHVVINDFKIIHSWDNSCSKVGKIVCFDNIRKATWRRKRIAWVYFSLHCTCNYHIPYLYWDVFKRQKTEDKLSKKKKNRAKILTAALQTSFLGPRRKHLSQYMDPSIKHRLQTTSASTKVLDNGQVNLLTYKTTAVQ